MYRVAQFPSVTTTAGSMIAIRSSSHGLHASSSSGSGSRLPGGRHRITLLMYTSSRGIPISLRSWFSS